MNLLDKKILIYHNITPSHFFAGENHIQFLCNQGREQLKDSPKFFIGSYGDSKYNCQELKYYNYPNPTVMPILMDLDKKISTPPNEKIVQKHSSSYNILFVGRVAQNKCQHQLIDVILQLKLKGIENIKLFIVGGVSQPKYFEYLKIYSKNLRLENQVIITNKVSDEDLSAYYKSSDLYLTLSEHEGFGMPLIEAMKYDIPILAYNSGGIGSTAVCDSLMNKKAPSYVAERIIKLQKDPFFRVNLIKKQKEHLETFSYQNRKIALTDYLTSLNITVPNLGSKSPHRENKITYQIEGPYDSSYSLAIVNKNIALSLNKNENLIKLYSTEGDGDFEPNLKNLNQDVKNFVNQKLENIDITIRNLYPPRTNAMSGFHKIIGPYGWEESKFPAEYVFWFNSKLTLIFTMSNYVKNLLKDNGVYTPIVTTGIVVEDILDIKSSTLPFKLPKNFKLLHISSAFPRKGIDKLLEVFDNLDLDISLIIKTFPNPHNNTIKQIEDLNFKLFETLEEDIFIYKKEKKEILLINKDLPQSQIKYLYENSNILVAPSFGEGFGLPMAEAMLLEIPVITTRYGGQSDFCFEDNSWLIDFDFAYSKTHINQNSSVWAEAKSLSLGYLIEKIYNLSDDSIKQKTVKAKKYILDNYSSKKVALNIQNAIAKYQILKTKPKIALFSTFNTKCGIAEYSKNLISEFKDEVVIFADKTTKPLITKENQNLTRCWSERFIENEITQLKQLLLKNQITQFIIQYNFAFLSLKKLEELIYFCENHNIKTHLFLHSTKDVFAPNYTDSLGCIAQSLQKVTKIYTHTVTDMNYLKHFRIYKNSYLFTHGIDDSLMIEIEDEYNEIPTIATFGFLLPQKGVLELVDIAIKLHNLGKKVNLLLLTALYDADISKKLENQLKQKIENSNIKEYITLNTDFLPQEEIIKQLSNADKIVFSYKNSQESSSAAIRMGILSQKEVITTPIEIFDDVKNIVTQSPNGNVESISQTIFDSLNRDYDNKNQLDWIDENSWKKISQRFYNSLF